MGGGSVTLGGLVYTCSSVIGSLGEMSSLVLVLVERLKGEG